MNREIGQVTISRFKRATLSYRVNRKGCPYKIRARSRNCGTHSGPAMGSFCYILSSSGGQEPLTFLAIFPASGWESGNSGKVLLALCRQDVGTTSPRNGDSGVPTYKNYFGLRALIIKKYIPVQQANVPSLYCFRAAARNLSIISIQRS